MLKTKKVNAQQHNEKTWAPLSYLSFEPKSLGTAVRYVNLKATYIDKCSRNI